MENDIDKAQEQMFKATQNTEQFIKNSERIGSVEKNIMINQAIIMNAICVVLELQRRPV